MKRYRLLRDNKEFGPFLLGEFRSFGLYSTDLVWVEEESNSWRHAAEIPELKLLVRNRPAKPATVARNRPSPASSVPLGIDESLSATGREKERFGDPHDTATDDYFAAAKEKIEFRAKPRRLSLTAVTANLFGLGVLLIGVMLGAFVVKKIVDHFESEPIIASANAVEITSETLPVNTGNYAAKTISPQKTLEPVLAPAVMQTDTVKTKAVQTKPQSLAVAKNETLSTETKAEKLSPSVANKTDQQVAELTEASDQPTEKTEAAETARKAPSLALSANEYKVGMFGGISGLEITVNNPSSTPVSRAVVEVEFLKPNGNVVKTQTLTVENISPGGAKKVSVPSSNRGVNVRYRIVGVDV